MTTEEAKEKFSKFWDEHLDEKDDCCVDCWTLAFLAYKQGLDDGWDDAIMEHS